MSSLRRGHANLLCIVPILSDDPRRESDVVQLAQQIQSGGLAKETHTPLPRSRRWAQWIFSFEEVWKEDADMNDRPLVHAK